VRASTRLVRSADGAGKFDGRVGLFAPGVKPVILEIPDVRTGFTPAGKYALGPVHLLEAPLPAGITDEVICDIRVRIGTMCGAVITRDGLLLDDLRVE